MKLMPLLGCAVLMCTATVYAATTPVTASPPSTATVKPLTPQQERMKDCNARAGEQHLKGAERRTYMHGCLSGKPEAAATMTPQQQRMKDCNVQANEQHLKGAARKTFMSSCLKGS